MILHVTAGMEKEIQEKHLETTGVLITISVSRCMMKSVPNNKQFLIIAVANFVEVDYRSKSSITYP